MTEENNKTPESLHSSIDESEIKENNTGDQNDKIFEINKENEINLNNNKNEEEIEKDNINTNVLPNLGINTNDNHDSIKKTDDENIDKNVKEEIQDENDNAVDIDNNNFEMEKHEITLTKEEVENDPNFAIICSFFEKFGHYLELKYSIINLKNMFEDEKALPELIDLHIKLLRKRRKYINKEKWEKALKSFCLEYSSIDAWELENFGYKNIKLSLRLRILVRLLEAMFDYNQKFKSELNTSCDSSDLRVPAFGRDITGYTYWYQIDPDLNFRLYKDEPDEEASWSLVSKNLEEFNECIQELEKKAFEDFKCSSTPNSEESNSNQALNLLPKKLESINENYDNDEDEKKEKIISNNEDYSSETKSPVIIPEKDEIENAKETNDEVKKEISCDQTENLKINDEKEIILEKEEIRTCENESNSLVYDIDPCPIQNETTVEEEISFIYESIITKIEEENDSGDDDDEEEEEGEQSSKPHKKTQRSRRGKGRGRRKNRKSNSKNKNNQQKEEINKSNECETKSKSVGRKRRSEIEKLQENFAEALTTKRSSRRIQALQEKKLIEMQEEQRKLERELLEKRRKKEAAEAARAAALLSASLACDKSNDSNDYRRSKKRKKKIVSDDDYQKDSSDDEEQNDKKKKKRKRGKGKRRKGANPWEDSEEYSDEKHENIYEDDEYDYILDDDNEELKFDDNEDEFACEEIDPNDEPVVVRRARTVKKSKDDFSDFDLENIVNDDKPCGKCGKYDKPQWILLCDKCDDGYHTSCLRPPLFLIPSGEWFCPPCEHKLLVEKLQIEYKRLSEELERRAFENKKQKKRWKFGHCDISSENILDENAENTKETVDNEQTEGKMKNSRKRVKRNNRNVNLKDEIEYALDSKYSDSENSDSISEDDDEDDDDDRSDSEEDESSAISSEDEIGRQAFSDDDDDDNRGRHADHHHHHHHRNRNRKHKSRNIDINDYSRSGLKLRSARKRKPINYRFEEYDHMIKSAILQEEEEEYPADDDDLSPGSGLPRSKGKDIENILKANAEMPDFSINPFETSYNPEQQQQQVISNDVAIENISQTAEIENPINPVQDVVKKFEDDDDDDDIQGKRQKNKNRKQQKKKGLTNLDFSDDEVEEDHASDEDFKMADDDDEMDEELTEIEEDAAGDTETESDSDFKTSTRRRSSRVSTSRYSSNRSKKSKKKKRRNKPKRKFLVDTDEEDDEEEDEISSEDELIDSYSDESSDYMPQPRRAAMNKRYREASSTEDDDYADYAVDKKKTKAKDKYQEDEDYDEFCEDDDEDDRRSKKNVKEPEPKLKTSVLNYSQECRTKKRKIDVEKVETNVNDNIEDSDKKLNSKPTTATIDNDDGDAKEDDKSMPVNDQKSDAKNTSESQNVAGGPSLPPANENVLGNKTEPTINNDQSSSYYPSQQHQQSPSNVSMPSYSKNADPLNSMKQMNSKFDYVNVPQSAPSATTTSESLTIQPPLNPPPPQAVPQSSYSVAPAPLPIHFQRNPYHPPPPYSSIPTPYNPPQNPPNYSIPPPTQPQYLNRPTAPPSGPAYSTAGPTSQHTMPPPQYPQQQQSSPIRQHLSHPPNSQNVYSPGLYPQPPPSPRYTSPIPPPRPNEKLDDSGYTLTNLDSYNKKPSNYAPPPPPSYGPNYAAPPPPSRSDGPSQILNLDSGANSFPSYSAGPPPTGKPLQPHYYSGPGYENMLRHPPPPDYYGAHPPPHTTAGNANFYASGPSQPPPGIHTHGIQRMPTHSNPYQQHRGQNPIQPPPPSHYIPRNTSPRQVPPSPTSSPISYSPTMVNNSLQSTTTAISSSSSMIQPTSTYSSPPNSNVYPPPPHPSAAYPSYSPMQGYPPYPPVAASNGGFMIQNILLNRPPVAKQPPVCAVKSSPKATKSVPKTKKTKESTTIVEPKAIGEPNQNPIGTGNKSQPKTKSTKTKKTKNQINSEVDSLKITATTANPS